MAGSGYRGTLDDGAGRVVEANVWVTLALLCAVQWADVLGTTIMLVALPSIQADLGMSGAALELAAAIYALVFGGLIVIAGRLSDMYGPRRLFLLGLVVFCTASLLCGLAISPAMLIGARALEGLGAALAIPAALTMVTGLFPEGPAQHRAFGIWTAAAAGGGAAGFTLGGLVTDAVGWRWIFLLNIPIGLIALAILPRLIGDRWTRGVPARINARGAVWLASGLVALLAGLTRSKEDGIASRPVLAIMTAGAILLVTFVISDRRSDAPLIPHSLLRSRALVASALVAFALTAATGATGVLMTLYMQHELGLSPSRTRIMLAPFSVAVVLGSMAGARFTDRFGFRASMACGLAGVATAIGVEAVGAVVGSLALLVVGFAVSGAALGCASVASTAGGLSTIEEDRKGVASGLLGSMAKIGTALGIALIPALGAAWIGAGSLAGIISSSALAGGYRAAFVIAALVAVLAIPVVWLSFREESARARGKVPAITERDGVRDAGACPGGGVAESNGNARR